MAWLKETLDENRRTVAAWSEWKRRAGVSEDTTEDIISELLSEILQEARRRQAENARLKAELAQCQMKLREQINRCAYHAHKDELAQAMQSFKRRETAFVDALKGILELGRKDLSNPKYDAYFEEAKRVIEEAGE